MTEIKPTLKGFKNLVTVDDFKNEISLVEILINQYGLANTSQLIKYKHRLGVALRKFFENKEKSL